MISGTFNQLSNSALQIALKRGQIKHYLFTNSKNVKIENFDRIHANDLVLLFKAYNEIFFDKQFERFPPFHLTFGFSSRLRKSAGVTRYYRYQGQYKYRISISSYLTFYPFSKDNNPVEVNGVICKSRLEALMCVMEHEIIHLCEFLTTGKSSCGQTAFKDLAFNIFGHTFNKHKIGIEPKEPAVYDFQVGDKVSFNFRGLYISGNINRITKRATVMSGKRKYYVPLSKLKKES
jgi:hypothetical protein